MFFTSEAEPGKGMGLLSRDRGRKGSVKGERERGKWRSGLDRQRSPRREFSVGSGGRRGGEN